MEFIGFVSDLRSRQPIQYMERLYKHQEFLKTMNVEVHVVDTYNDSPMKVKYNIHYILSQVVNLMQVGVKLTVNIRLCYNPPNRRNT